jgi:hypothetical protein
MGTNTMPISIDDFLRKAFALLKEKFHEMGVLAAETRRWIFILFARASFLV